MKRYVHHDTRADMDATAAEMRLWCADRRKIAALIAWQKRKTTQSISTPPCFSQPAPRPAIAGALPILPLPPDASERATGILERSPK